MANVKPILSSLVLVLSPFHIHSTVLQTGKKWCHSASLSQQRNLCTMGESRHCILLLRMDERVWLQQQWPTYLYICMESGGFG